MGILGLVIMIVGDLIALVGGIWILVLAFKQSVLWGLGSLFVPFVALVFVIKYWAVAKKPFLINLAGVVLIVIGVVLGGAGFHQVTP